MQFCHTSHPLTSTYTYMFNVCYYCEKLSSINVLLVMYISRVSMALWKVWRLSPWRTQNVLLVMLLSMPRSMAARRWPLSIKQTLC